MKFLFAADPLATSNENGDNDEPAEEPEANEENDASDAEEADDAEEENDKEEDDDKPLKAKNSKKSTKKKEKKAAKKAAKKSKKKEKKRVSLNVPADKVDPEDDTDEDEEEEEAEYEVQNIVDHRYVGKRLEYKIRWKGYSAKDDTWEAKNSLSCPEIIKKYEASQKSSPKASTSSAKKRKGGKSPAKPAKKARKDESEEEEDEDEDAEYEVARLLEVRTRKGKREFLVHWKGWSARFDNWEPEENLNCDELIQKFDEKLDKAKSASQKDLRAAPKSTKRYAVDPKHKGARTSKRGGGRTRVTYYDDE